MISTLVSSQVGCTLCRDLAAGILAAGPGPGPGASAGHTRSAAIRRYWKLPLW